ATSNLDLESKKATHTKLSWQQPVNVFLAAGRPPGMEQLHQEAQLNLQSLLQVLGCGGGIQLLPLSFWGLTPLLPLPPPSRRDAEEESTGTGTSTSTPGTRPPDTPLSLPTSPDRPPAWGSPFPLPPLEEKPWYQTSVVPINVS
ncbi:NHSL1 protein, partial [Turnix velox]|nr:NHSL1 protein [Turnix velox]